MIFNTIYSKGPKDQRTKKDSNGKGFTLVELMVSISIIAIISSVGLTTYKNAQVLSHDSKRKSDLHQIQVALELYYNNHKSYPLVNGSPENCSNITCSINSDWQVSSDSTSWIDGLDPYINQQPHEASPESPPLNVYFYKTNQYSGCPAEGQWYALMVNLENSSDPDTLANKDVLWCDGVTSLRSWFSSYPNFYAIVVKAG